MTEWHYCLWVENEVRAKRLEKGLLKGQRDTEGRLGEPLEVQALSVKLEAFLEISYRQRPYLYSRVAVPAC
jgi:hypothetical protein